MTTKKIRVTRSKLAYALAAICVMLSHLACKRGAGTSNVRVPETSIVRYASEEFVGAFVVRPQSLVDHPNFVSLPIARLLPEKVTYDKFERMGIEEFAVFVGQSQDEGHTSKFELAAAAEFADTVELEKVVMQWNETLVPGASLNAIELTSCQIGGQKCMRIPAGSFLTPARMYGTLEFTDRNGDEVERGLSVGRVNEYRSFLEGGSLASAIVSFENLSEDLLIGDQLAFEIRQDVFATRYLDHDYSEAQLQLRNPDSGLVSEPILFEAKSYVNQRLDVPVDLNATQDGETRRVNLWDDFVSNGNLEVIIKGNEPGLFYGLGTHDFNVLVDEYEYVFVSDNELVIAQSRETLESMLEAEQHTSPLSQLAYDQDADFILALKGVDRESKKTVDDLVEAMVSGLGVDLPFGPIDELKFRLDVDHRDTASLDATFLRSEDANEALRTVQATLGFYRGAAPEMIKGEIYRLDTKANLASLGFGGIPMSFPDFESPLAEARIPALVAIVTDLLNAIDMESEGKSLHVEFGTPDRLNELTEEESVAIANLDETIAHDLFQYDRFDLGDEMMRRVTDRFPEEPALWFRRAHQLSFNVSVEYDGTDDRYAWVQRGFASLLEGMKLNPNSSDMPWVLAGMITRRIGQSDERARFRKRFSEDEALAKGLGSYIDIEKAMGPDAKLDCWLVAKLLYERSIQMNEDADANTSISTLAFRSRPAFAQVRYADYVTQEGHIEVAQGAWKEGEQLWLQFGREPMELKLSMEVTLEQLPRMQEAIGTDHPRTKELELARQMVQYDYWLARCKLEQTEELQGIRVAMRESLKLESQGNIQEAFERYEHTLKELIALYPQYPQELALIASEFKELAEGMRRCADLLDKSIDDSLEEALLNIEQSKPRSEHALLDLRSVELNWNQ